MYEYVSINEQLIAVQNGFHVCIGFVREWFNPLNTKLNPICHFLALLEAHRILHVSRMRVKIRFVLSNVSAATLCSGRHVACRL
jgi:hypothetical protein